jgi:YYY domain-containing protein
MAMQPTRLVHVLTIFGLPLTSITVLVGALILWAIRQPKNTHPKRPWLLALGIVAGLLVALFILMLVLGWIIAVSPEGEARIVNLARELDLNLAGPPGSQEIGARIGWASRAVGLLLPIFFSARISQPALILYLTILLAGILYLLVRFLNETEHDDDLPRQLEVGQSLPFVLLIAGVGALLVLVPEFVYLRDNFGQRLNTIFKFYYQAWVFFGVAAVFGLEYLLRRFKAAGLVTSAVYIFLLIFGLLYPFYAVQSRSIEYRGLPSSETRLPATLDGLAYLKQYDWAEYDAIQWLRENVEGTPVILEATGGQYSSYGRVAAATGLPTVLGWAGHEYQWRGYTNEPGERAPAISTIYGSRSWNETASLLDQYNVSLIYYGRLERNDYGITPQDKFDENLEVAYKSQGVTIYRWNPDT